MLIKYSVHCRVQCAALLEMSSLNEQQLCTLPCLGFEPDITTHRACLVSSVGVSEMLINYNLVRGPFYSNITNLQHNLCSDGRF